VHSAPAESFKFTVDKGRLWYNHIANMTDLVPATKYFYCVVTSPSSSSQIMIWLKALDQNISLDITHHVALTSSMDAVQ
jgi:hypothetical protein